MNILEIAGSGTIGTDHMGPVSDTIFNLCKEFNLMGHKVTIVDSIARHNRYKNSKNIRIIQIGTPLVFETKTKTIKIFKYINYWLKEFIYILKLKYILNTSKFDVIHVHETLTAYFVKLLIRKKNIVYTSHTSIWGSSFYNERVQGKIYSFFLKSIGAHEKKIIQSFPLTIGLGNYLKKNIDKANIKIIPNGINIGNKLWDKKEARKCIGMDSNIFLITIIARISPIKGFEVLIDAIRKIDCNPGKLQVNIIGSLSGSFDDSKTISAYAKKIMNQAEHLPINFLGFVSNVSEHFSHLLASSDLFILPSFFEPQGKVVLEAMAHGVPVIGSDAGGIPEMITSETGFIFRSGDSQQLSEIIKSILEKKEILHAMRPKCHKHVQENYNWRLIAEKHVQCFEELIGISSKYIQM
jgi:glycosyltransferase involved in cell wall biosynthesis